MLYCIRQPMSLSSRSVHVQKYESSMNSLTLRTTPERIPCDWSTNTIIVGQYSIAFLRNVSTIHSSEFINTIQYCVGDSYKGYVYEDVYLQQKVSKVRV
jgi:hypothetical protein